jgi:predicted dehydrogenase
MNAMLKPETARPRLGFLGVGWIGRQRMAALDRSGVATVAAIADPSPAALDEAARAVEGASLHGSLDELLDCDLDGIVIATPSAAHGAQARRALERGLAVFCQKPLACTAAEARAVVAAARTADRLLGVDYSYRHVHGVPQLRELVRNGDIGDVYAVDLTFHNAYGPDQRWYYDLALSGGGCVMDLGVHLVDLAMWVLDHPRVASVDSQLFAQGKPLAKPVSQLEDFAVAQIVLDGGAVVRLTCSWRVSAGCDAVIGASFFGSRGGAALHNVGGSFYDFEVARFDGTQREVLAGPPDDWGGRALVDWAQRLAADRRFDPESARLADVAGLIDTLYGRADG